MISTASPGYFSRLNSYSRNFVDVFSATGNPATGVLLSTPAVGIGVERRFMLAELSQYTMVGILPTRLGSFGLHMNYFGSGGYSEIEPAIIYARQLGQVDLGIKFKYHLLSIAGYGNKASLITELGTLWHLTEKVHTGLSIHNPISILAYDSSHDRFGFAYETGIGYEVSNFVFIGISIRKVEDRKVEVNTAIHYQFANQFFANLGFSTPGPQARIGAGWKNQSLRIDVTASWHLRLGISPGLLLFYQPMKQSK
jgi:hypothetical protein